MLGCANLVPTAPGDPSACCTHTCSQGSPGLTDAV